MEKHSYGIRLLIPDWTTLDLPALLIAVAAFISLFRTKLGLIPTLAGSATAGLIYRLLLQT
jgi:chromate transporter